MKNILYITSLLIISLSVNAQYTSPPIPYSNFGVNGGGSSSTLIINSSTIQLNIGSCGFTTTQIQNKVYFSFEDYTGDVPNMNLGTIAGYYINGTSTTPVNVYRIVVYNKKLYVFSDENLTLNQKTINGISSSVLTSSLTTFSPILPQDIESLNLSEENYIRETNYLTDDENGNKIVETTFFDDLGNPKQNILHKLSNSQKNIVTPIVYDYLGRQAKDYLPYVSNSSGIGYEIAAENDDLNFYQNPTFASTENSNFESTTNPFSQKEFEPSPLNRIIKQSAPGNDWVMGQGHEIKFEYLFNSENEVKNFSASSTWSNSYNLYEIGLINSSGNVFYAANQLYKTVTKNENWILGKNNTTEEFKNKEGQLILKRTYSDYTETNGLEIAHDTYYVYDIYGNLTFVIPPLVNLDDGISSDELNGLCYQYQYDHRNRLVAKKLPGKQWEYIAYNSQDKPIATGPALDPFGGTDEGWLISKYDIFGRVVYTGWYDGTSVDGTGRVNIENQLTANWYETATTSPTMIDNVAVNYTNATTPTNIVLLTVNYYDHYNIPGLPTGTITNTIEGENVSTNAKGLATGSWTRVLDGSSAQATGILSYVLYDSKGRVISTYTGNHLGGYTRVDSKLDFTGKALYTLTYHKRRANDALLNIKDSYTYTFGERLRYHIHQINDEPEQILTNNEYDALGQLILKRVGGEDGVNAPLQNVDYTYNIRGWLTNINDIGNLGDDLFAFKIGYNQVGDNLNHTIDPLYNGNITEMYWRSSSDNVQRKYSYQYDSLNRLRNAIYQKPENTVPVTNMYNESMSYDKNGNITGLQRNGALDSDVASVGALTIDLLTYTYSTTNPNQLMRVDDDANSSLGFKNGTNTDDDYIYDDNGNMLTDKNKEITQNIRYNHLNLPVTISIGANQIIYLYTATGQKLRKEVRIGSETITTDYLNGFQYVNGSLQFFPTAEGYVNVSYCNECQEAHQMKFNYVYNYTDHLGNIRMSYGWDDNENVLKILEENHYYPFGLKHTNYNVQHLKYVEINPYETGYVLGEGKMKITQINPTINNVTYKYKYNGKEYQDELGLNMYDYGARNYDPAIGRWMSIDNLAEKNSFESTFTYCGNNPIVFKDPDGNDKRYFDIMGQEIVSKRVVSNEIHETYIAKNKENKDFSQVPMPNVICEKKGITEKGISFSNDVSTPEYQELDYLIAARTGLFNQTKNSGNLTLYTEGGDLIPQEAIKQIDDLDPTLVKAIAMQESTMAKESNDIMTANNPLDIGEYKNAYGLYTPKQMNINNSLYFGIRFLATKGFKNGVKYDRKTGKKTYTFHGWNNAAGNYNGGGVDGYQEYIEDMIINSFRPRPHNYYKYKPQ